MSNRSSSGRRCLQTLRPQSHATKLTERDAEWAIIQPLIPVEKPGGRHRSVDIREVINAVFYLNKTRCSWEMLQKDFPPYSTVYYYHRRWQRHSVWEEINRTLRELVRQDVDKNALPTAAEDR